MSMINEDKIQIRNCDCSDCKEQGTFCAPRSRNNLREYFYFCLEHVREYNARWNFCDGMNINDMEAEIKNASCWERPTWPLGSAGKRRYENADIRDDFDFNANFKESRKHSKKSGTSNRKPNLKYKNSEGEAFQTMGLSARASLTELKARYKELVKRLHPDLNGKNNQAEERLKIINQAYSMLKKNLV